MAITAWPVVDGRRVVAVYKPGTDPSASSPLRTLKRNKWASDGVRVSRRVDGHLRGRMSVYSVLNLDAARLARTGYHAAAVTAAQAAAELEASPEFLKLQHSLSELSDDAAQQVLAGELPANPPGELVAAIKAVARRTAALRLKDLDALTVDTVLGKVTEVHEDYVIVAIHRGPGTTAIPRWLASAVHRASVGSLLALITDKLAEGSARVEALPAIAVDDEFDARPFDPFGRDDPRAREITEEGARLLARKPAPLKILVPVTIEE